MNILILAILLLFLGNSERVDALQIRSIHNRLGVFQKRNVGVTAATKNSNRSVVVSSVNMPAAGDATIATSSFNLAKSLIGAGVLSLPGGVALFSDNRQALVPATLACAAFASMAAYSFSVIGKVCKQHKATNFKDAWSKSVSPSSSWVITSVVTSLCFLGSLAYSIIIGDSFLSLFQSFHFPTWLAQRANVILLLSSTTLLPLCLLKNLSSLVPFSVLGLGGTLYAAAFMILRYFDSSYEPGGQFFENIPVKPSFDIRGGSFFSKLSIVLLSTLSSAYIAHFNAPKFYSELKDSSTDRFNQVVLNGFGAAFVIFTLFISVGFLTFGGATDGFVLNNYASSDNMAKLSRLAIGMALLTGYPFMFSALRDGVLDLMNVSAAKRSEVITPTSIGLLVLITALALMLKDVGLVVSLTGAVFGNAIMFIIPSIMYLATLRAQSESDSKCGKTGSSHRTETIANYLMIGTGVVMTVQGVAVNILRQLGKM